MSKVVSDWAAKWESFVCLAIGLGLGLGLGFVFGYSWGK